MTLNQFVFYLFFTLLLVTLLTSSCDQEITVDLPAFESELVVESYLEPDLPYIVSVTESVSYFSPIGIPVVTDAIVTIAYQDRIDTLAFIDSLNFYINTTQRVQFDEVNPYHLRVEDQNGRVVEATTQFLPPPTIDTITYSFNDSLQASVVLFFEDGSADANWYKVLFTDANDFDPTFTWEFPDETFASQRTLSGVGFQYDVGDTVLVRLHNISEDYYVFLEALNDATNAVDNPIARPSRLNTNIVGGQGIFTALSYEEKLIVIEER